MKEANEVMLDSLLNRIAYRGLTHEIVILKRSTYTEYYVELDDFNFLKEDLEPLGVGFTKSETLRAVNLHRSYTTDRVLDRSRLLAEKIGFICYDNVMDILLDYRISYGKFVIHTFVVSD